MTTHTTPAATTTTIDRVAARLAADPAELERALADVTFLTPPENQGQIVEVSYGADCAGLVFRRTFDRSDRSVCYAVADVDDCGCDSECDCFEPWNGVPVGFHWVSITPEPTPELVEYTYSVFDADPAVGGSAWPAHNGEPVPPEYCGSPEEALEHALDIAKDEGEACGEYAAGDRLWVIVYGPEQNYTGSVELEGDEDEADDAEEGARDA